MAWFSLWYWSWGRLHLFLSSDCNDLRHRILNHLVFNDFSNFLTIDHWNFGYDSTLTIYSGCDDTSLSFCEIRIWACDRFKRNLNQAIFLSNLRLLSWNWFFFNSRSNWSLYYRFFDGNFRSNSRSFLSYFCFLDFICILLFYWQLRLLSWSWSWWMEFCFLEVSNVFIAINVDNPFSQAFMCRGRNSLVIRKQFFIFKRKCSIRYKGAGS